MIQPPINSEKRCRVCDAVFKPFKTTDRFCSYKCANEFQNNRKSNKTTPKQPIRKFSKKRQKQNKQYSVDRKEFLSLPENKICFIDGCKEPSTTIEHRKGRVGYADEWARENDIPLLLDKRFWAGCCLNHNLELERNPELSKQYQLSKIHNGKKGE